MANTPPIEPSPAQPDDELSDSTPLVEDATLDDGVTSVIEPTTAAGAGASAPVAARKRTFIGDVIQGLAGRFTAVICTFAMGIVTARIWGAEARGLIAEVINWPHAIIIFFELGMLRTLPYILGRGRRPINEVISASLSLWLISSLLATVAAAAILMAPFTTPYPTIWIVMACILVPANVFNGYARGFALGVQKPRFLTHLVWGRWPIAFVIVLGGGLVLGLTDPSWAWLYILGQIGAGFVTIGMGLWLMAKHGRLSVALPKQTLAPLVRRSISFGASGFVMSINEKISVLVLSLTLFAIPKADIGNFAIGVVVGNMLWQFPQTMNVLLLSKGAAARDSKQFARLTAAAARVTTFAGLPPVALLFFIAPLIIPAIYGPDFDKAGLAVQILLPGILLFFPARVYEAGFNARGHTRPVLWTMGVAGIVNVVLNVLLIPRYGIYGAALGGSVSYAVGALVMAVMYARVSGIGLAAVLLPQRSDIDLAWHHAQPLLAPVRRLLKR